MSGPTRDWPGSLNVQELLASGWRPAPFNEFVLKVHSRCSLACDYCYMYTSADQGWQRQPGRMSAETIDQVVMRIAEHAAVHELARLSVILHGGEPMLAGLDRLSRISSQLRAELPGFTQLLLVLQTNGLHLTARNLLRMSDLGIQIGVSLDGTAADHDRHRRYKGGAGSHAAVTRGIALLSGEPYRHLFRGLLCTVDLRSDPCATYRALLKFGPPAIDFLLPHGNWSRPPVGLDGTPPGLPSYADWLIAVFDAWYGVPVQEVRIRLFEEILHALLTGHADVEGLGLAPSRIVVIATDGSIEQSDILKSAYDGAAHTGLRVQDAPLDAALLLPAIAARQLGRAGLSATCRSCNVHRICGGGHYAHRYRAGSGFLNPSVYCAELHRLIVHIRDRVAADIAEIRASCRTGT